MYAAFAHKAPSHRLTPGSSMALWIAVSAVGWVVLAALFDALV